ncbi:MAG: hypothetical protein M3R27_05670 [Bacteroidota bacterium]|nr:hypothetical protein [Bacteroidota bacterium]
MNTKYKIIFALKIVFGITAFLIVLGFGTMFLWNWLVPTLFNGPVVTYWQAIGLLALCKILFGGCGKGFKKGGRCGDRSHWKARMEERMKNMSPEERERIKDRCKSKFRMPENESGSSNNKDL